MWNDSNYFSFQTIHSAKILLTGIVQTVLAFRNAGYLTRGVRTRGTTNEVFQGHAQHPQQTATHGI
jgi:hypothetical protein